MHSTAVGGGVRRFGPSSSSSASSPDYPPLKGGCPWRLPSSSRYVTRYTRYSRTRKEAGNSAMKFTMISWLLGAEHTRPTLSLPRLLRIPSAHLDMHLGAGAHVVVHGVIFGGLQHVRLGLRLISQGFKIESEVKMRIAAMIAQ